MLEALGVSITEIIFALINFLILVFILAKCLYRPTLNMFEKRRVTIQSALDEAEAARQTANQELENYRNQIADAEEEARQIVKTARAKAELQAEEIIDDAIRRAGSLRIQASKSIEREKIKAASEMRDQVATLAIMAAEQIMEKEVTVSGQDEIIDKVIERAGASEWQN